MVPGTEREALATAWAGDYDRRGQVARVRERDVQVHPALIGGPLGRAREAKRRSRGIPALDLDLVEAQAAEAERLERRLLGGEARGEVPGGMRAGIRGFELALGEDPASEGGPPFERALDPVDFDQVDAGADGQSPTVRT